MYPAEWPVTLVEARASVTSGAPIQRARSSRIHVLPESHMHDFLPMLQAAAVGFTKEYTGAWAMFGAGLGAGVAVIGAGLGIGRIGGESAEAMARQPERAGQIQTAGLILAALIEGVALFAIVVTFLIQSKFSF
jgi:F-type H+-transporting ATPase subunit c